MAALWLATMPACTHLTPYYRSGQARAVASVEASEIDHRLLLVGDAGSPEPGGEPALQLLTHQAGRLPERTTVVFLGDNIYERGMPDPIKAVVAKSEMETEVTQAVDAAADVADAILPDVFNSRQEAERHINAQIDVVRHNRSRALFIPGNHDWDQFEIGGWDRVLNQESYVLAVAAREKLNLGFLPPGGCPGPSAVALGTKAKVIALDTQWWLETRKDGKPTKDNNPTDCPFTDEREIRDAIVSELAKASEAGRWAIVTAHHPLATKGPHGGYFDIRTHLFPLHMIGDFVPFYIEWLPMPVLGSIAVGVRKCCSPSPQDMPNRRNRHMRNAILHAMIKAARLKATPLAYAAGHDHSLQLFESEHGPPFLLVSGIGSAAHASAVGSGRHTLFAHSNPFQPGFMQIDFLKNGGVRLAVIERTAQHLDGVEVFSLFMAQPNSRPGLRR